MILYPLEVMNVNEAEAHRQSAAVAASEHAADDQAYIDALSFDGG